MSDQLREAALKYTRSCGLPDDILGVPTESGVPQEPDDPLIDDLKHMLGLNRYQRKIVREAASRIEALASEVAELNRMLDICRDNPRDEDSEAIAELHEQLNDQIQSTAISDAQVLHLEASLASAQAVISAIAVIHKPYGIYSECVHDHDGIDGPNVVQVEDIGYTCAKEYDICAACCKTHDGQSETCADYHDHGPDKLICATVALLPGEQA